MFKTVNHFQYVYGSITKIATWTSPNKTKRDTYHRAMPNVVIDLVHCIA